MPKCSGRGKTLFQVDAYDDHKVTRQYRALAVEVEQRVLNRDSFLDGTLVYSLPPIEDAADAPDLLG